MVDILATPYVSPTAEPAEPTRGVRWVLGLAVALLVVAAWLMILFQLALVVRAELRLQQVLAQASEFAELPQIRTSDIQAFVDRRLVAANYPRSSVTIGRDASGPKCVSVSIAASDALPAWMKPLAIGLENQTIEAHLHATPQPSFFAGTQ